MLEFQQLRELRVGIHLLNLNLKSEISDIIDFILEIEKSEFISKFEFTSEVLKYIEIESFILAFKNFLPPQLYQKQLWQYSLSKRCESKLIADLPEKKIYDII